MSEHTPNLISPATYSVPELARRLGCSTRQIHRLRDSGALPAPIRLGRLLRWQVAEIEAWIAAKCPSRDKWEAMQRKK